MAQATLTPRSADPAALSLTVLDRGNTPVEGATVFLDRTAVGTTTTGGRLTVEGIDAGDHGLEVRGEFYDPWQGQLSAPAGASAAATAHLKERLGLVTLRARPRRQPVDVVRCKGHGAPPPRRTRSGAWPPKLWNLFGNGRRHLQRRCGRVVRRPARGPQQRRGIAPSPRCRGGPRGSSSGALRTPPSRAPSGCSAQRCCPRHRRSGRRVDRRAADGALGDPGHRGRARRRRRRPAGAQGGPARADPHRAAPGPGGGRAGGHRRGHLPEVGSDVIEGPALIEEVARTLRTRPEIKRVRIEGHTDARGEAGLNQDLSERRAAVRGALVDLGVDAGAGAGRVRVQPALGTNDTERAAPRTGAWSSGPPVREARCRGRSPRQARLEGRHRRGGNPGVPEAAQGWAQRKPMKPLTCLPSVRGVTRPLALTSAHFPASSIRISEKFPVRACFAGAAVDASPPRASQ